MKNNPKHIHTYIQTILSMAKQRMKVKFFYLSDFLAPWHYFKTVNLKTPIKTMNYQSWVLGWGNKKDGSQCTWEVQNISTQNASISFMF